MKVLYRVHLHDTQTGEKAVYEDEWDPAVAANKGDPHSTVKFIYGEGNYSCDCNRRLFLLRALGQDPDLDDTECGDGRIVVEAIYAPDGTRVYHEDCIPPQIPDRQPGTSRAVGR